jgi:folate-binding protein YgfZ
MAIDANEQRIIHDVVWRVTGEDTRTWISGQVTNDVRGMNPGDVVYALILDTRGKTLCDVWIVERGTDVLLLVPEEVSTAVRAHLEDHIIMEDVAIEPLSMPVSWRGDPRDGRIELSAVDGPAIDDARWELERIRLGVPALRDFAQHYPQEAGLKRAVSFEKGCYLGQEVVCMLENRGQLTRRLVRLEGSAAGSTLEHEGKKVADITSAAQDPERGGFVALGYVKRALANPGTTLTTEGGTLAIVEVVGESQAGLREAPAL